MNTATGTYPKVAPVRRARDWMLVLGFSATLFCSAFLMFSIQPLIGKLLLPLLGGTPQVWNSCMVFFQVVLFVGYLHAHYTGVWLGLRRQALVHLAIAVAALLALPIGLTQLGPVPDPANPAPWILLTLALSIGAPMFVISSTAPLLQKWFSHTAHPAAGDPYFLYVASNLGSLLALLAYPILIEPWIDLSMQASLLSGGFVLLVAAIAACALAIRGAPASAAARDGEQGATSEHEAVTLHQKLRWTLLAFVPSSLLLGVTTYITTDLAAVPLLWIAPLALYLLTFVIAFARKPPVSHQHALRAHALLMSFLVVTMLSAVIGAALWWLMLVHLAAFFATALVCHGELVRTRPAARHLTHFYLWLSFGGVLGGAFNALVAPLVFDRPLEYALVLAVACWLRPGGWRGSIAEKRNDLVLPAMLVAAIAGGFWFLELFVGREGRTSLLIAFMMIGIGAALALLNFSGRRVRFAMGVSATVAAGALLPALGGAERHALETARSFFGIYEVYYDARREANFLRHGTTVHGAQSRKTALALEPSSYYHRAGPFGQVFESLAGRGDVPAVAVVGLGTGALTCYGNPSQAWTYYEIDPLIERIARDPRYFTYLRDCPPQTSVVLGDARLMLRKASDARYGLIVVDAFSSDAIPTHLLTREAIAGYFEKLSSDGILALHISNRHMNLEPIVGNLAQRGGFAARISNDRERPAETEAIAHAATVAVLARDEASLGALATDPRWRPLASRPGQRVWSDDYVNVLSALK